MRKQNSEFHMSFLSHEGTQLINNDYYGCVELDKFACYIIADGIETGDEAESAKTAIDAVAAAFSSHPSMSKRAIASYIRKAHSSLLSNTDQVRMKASITVVVTDYMKLRYGYVGNTRFNLFRGNYQIWHSQDHSLTQQMEKNNELPKDKVALHEERGNLTRYLGQDGLLVPQISKKIKLKDGDIAALFTRGIWEHCDQHDLSAAFMEAGKDPELAVLIVERLISDAHPEEIDNYTVAVIFINKVFVDPNKRQRLKLILSITIPVLIILLILGLVLFLTIRQTKEDRKNMELYLLNGIEYIQDDNYLKAQDELKQAYSLSLELKDSRRSNDISNYQKLVEAILNADDLLSQEEYEIAVQNYLHALDRSKYTDNLSQKYIEIKLKNATNYINVHDLLGLGDTLADRENYSMAEEKYMAARSLASQIYYTEGKNQAIEALTALYERMDKEIEGDKERSKSEITASDFIIQGNTAFQSGDMVSAQMYYTMAKEKYEKLGDAAMAASMDEKLKLVEEKGKEQEEQIKKADQHVKTGLRLQSEGDYANAKKEFIFAREIYAAVNEKAKLEDITAKIEIIDGFLTDSSKES